jgi:acyl-CoA thioester hydrolase
MAHLKTVEIRWRDLDAYCHVNNAVYATYLEECRDEFLARVIGPQYVLDFVLARVAIDFREELRQEDDTVVVSARLVRIGRSSLTLQEEIRKSENGQLSAEAEAVLVARDREAGRSRPLSDAERAACEGVLESPVGRDTAH